MQLVRTGRDAEACYCRSHLEALERLTDAQAMRQSARDDGTGNATDHESRRHGMRQEDSHWQTVSSLD